MFSEIVFDVEVLQVLCGYRGSEIVIDTDMSFGGEFSINGEHCECEEGKYGGE